MPEYTSVVTGGGIEQGETIAETAVREVKEEAGIDVVFVRELGVAESPTGHYVQVTSTERFLRRGSTTAAPFGGCPQRRPRALGATRRLRQRARTQAGRRLRHPRSRAPVFDHKGRPEVPTQVPAGRVDAHEGLEEGLRREVEEETGLTEIEIVGILADGTSSKSSSGPAHTRVTHSTPSPHLVARTRGSTQ
jgi:ADP-ribose pyrophosphatase